MGIPLTCIGYMREIATAVNVVKFVLHNLCKGAFAHTIPPFLAEQGFPQTNIKYSGFEAFCQALFYKFSSDERKRLAEGQRKAEENFTNMKIPLFSPKKKEGCKPLHTDHWPVCSLRYGEKTVVEN